MESQTAEQMPRKKNVYNKEWSIELFLYYLINCYKINSLTAEAVRIKDELEQIEIVNNDTELKIKEALETEFFFG